MTAGRRIGPARRRGSLSNPDSFIDEVTEEVRR
ncbi:MAG: hypothetical protein ACD_54C00180G0001, partial [uncultured bacterium]